MLVAIAIPALGLQRYEAC